MPTAVGHIRYNPSAASVQRKAWWCILFCGSGWYWWLSPQLRRELPGEWMMAVDRSRVFEGQRVDRDPRLALVRPTLQPPAWGPHISVFRGEKPQKNRNQWNSGKGPRWLLRGAAFEFDYNVEPRTNGHHWYLPVTCEGLGDLREFYGLPRKPRVPFHLTFAIQTE